VEIRGWLSRVAVRGGVAIAALLASIAVAAADTQLETRDGELRLRWNADLLRALGLTLERGHQASELGDYDVYPLRSERTAAWGLRGRSVRSLEHGAWRVPAGPTLRARGAVLKFADARIEVAGGERAALAIRGRDGAAWFDADQLLFDRSVRTGGEGTARTAHSEPDAVLLRSADLRVSTALAARLDRAELAGWVVGDLALAAPITAGQRLATAASGKDCGNPNWPGEPVPGGGTYRADVFLYDLAGQFVRCFGCDGSGGVDGQIVFAPTATLVNNVNQGTAVATIAGDPLGTSSALWTADVPWYQKFQPGSPFPPYDNDQHPFLVWNLYRIDANGALTQIGRSGAKHAFATSNDGAQCEACNGNHVLGRACADTYPVSSNEFSQFLGPRSEIIAASGRWGRCGSIYDADCDGVDDAPPVGDFEHRMIAVETSIDPALNPGASYLFEVWYVVRDDIQIYNTMGTRPATFAWMPQPAVWSMATQTPTRLGPAIDRWIAPGAGAGVRNDELATPEGHAKVAVRTTDLGNGQTRYDFAVMNFDFGRAVTQGTEPNLRVLSNHGFDRFEVARAPDAAVVSTGFVDGDFSAVNDWAATIESERIYWDAPNPGASHDWGRLHRFTIVAAAPPGNGEVRLRVTEPGTPASYAVPSYTVGALEFFADGFE
jgi:hypothetical protein